MTDSSSQQNSDQPNHSSESKQSFSGRTRRLKTPWHVKFTDQTASFIISLGGIGTILAVSLVGFILVWQAYPLFMPGNAGENDTIELPWKAAQTGEPLKTETKEKTVKQKKEKNVPSKVPTLVGKNPIHVEIDDRRMMGFALYDHGVMLAFDLKTGKEIFRRKLVDLEKLKAKISSWSIDPGIQLEEEDPLGAEVNGITQVTFGLSDGKVLFGSVYFRATAHRVFMQRLMKKQEKLQNRLAAAVKEESASKEKAAEKKRQMANIQKLKTTLESIKKRIDAYQMLGPHGLKKRIALEKVVHLEDKLLFKDKTQHYVQSIESHFGQPITFEIEGKENNQPIQKVDYADSENGEGKVALYIGGNQVYLFDTLLNEFTHQRELDEDEQMVLAFPKHERIPDYLLLHESGNHAYVAWKEGLLHRFNVREQGILAESLHLVNAGEHITQLSFAINRETLLCGDSAGMVRGWFLVGRGAAEITAEDSLGVLSADRIKAAFGKDAKEVLTIAEKKRVIEKLRRESPEKLPVKSLDGLVLHAVHSFSNQHAVTKITRSMTSRLLAITYANQTVRLCELKTDQTIFDFDLTEFLEPEEQVTHLMMAPSDDGILVATDAQLWFGSFSDQGIGELSSEVSHNAGSAHSIQYPEVHFNSLFFSVWYEGADRPEAKWQSSFEGVGPEPKYGLLPLIFGTLKATFYSMLFAAPLALLAAIYTSEFMAPWAKAMVKPTIEIMASIPSVVIGFLAALVLAPQIEEHLSIVLASFFVVPFVLILCAFIWNLIPYRLILILSRVRFLFVIFGTGLGMLAAYLLGPLFESLMFADNIKLWLDKQQGLATAGWILFLLPMSALLVTFVFVTMVNPWIRSISVSWTRLQFTTINLIKFGVGTALCLLVATLVAQVLTTLEFEIRDSLVGQYDQRNALVVGFAMAFAIIPIIYTIADDALSSVPKHLRSASLGAGATPWQTAIRIVIPTAMSGLFSALMIGLGRAVGETMIILMAAGNTPLMDYNIFNGFRTLASNLAVELPEAPQDSPHYRTLFFAALTLFFMTFVVNTLAEIIRFRFRRKAVQL